MKQFPPYTPEILVCQHFSNGSLQRNTGAFLGHFSTANWADETWFWPARNKDRSIRPAVQRKGCRVRKAMGCHRSWLAGHGFYDYTFCPRTGMVSRLPKVEHQEHQLESTGGEFLVQLFLDVHNLMRFAFAGCCSPSPCDVCSKAFGACCRLPL